MENYLMKISPKLAYIGDFKKGEIQIIEDKLGQDGFGIVYEDKFIKVVRDPVIFPDETEGGYVRILNRSEDKGTGGAVIIPIINGKIAFIRLFRHATRTWELELPRGFQEPNLSEEESVKNEILEELGVLSHAVKRLGVMSPNTGLLSSDIAVFIAELSQAPLDKAPEDDIEVYARELVPLEALERFLKEAPVRCSISLSAIYMAKIHGYL